jgi:hypothetical protein
MDSKHSDVVDNKTLDEGVSKELSNEAMQEFNIEDMCEHFSMLIYGRRRIGKTVLCHYIMSLLHTRFQNAFLFSKTHKTQGSTWDFVPEDNRVADFDEAKLTQILDDQIELVESALLPDGTRDKTLNPVVVILDDIVSDKRVQKSDILDKYYTLGRHANISVILLSQNAAASGSVSLQCRSNCDYIMATKMNQLDDYERMSRYYFGIEGWKKGIERVNQLTQKPFHFAVSDIQDNARTCLADCTYYITAPELEKQDMKFKIGKHEQSNATSGMIKAVPDDVNIFSEGISNYFVEGGDPLNMVLPGTEFSAQTDEKNIERPKGLRPMQIDDDDGSKDRLQVHGVDEITDFVEYEDMDWDSD